MHATKLTHTESSAAEPPPDGVRMIETRFGEMPFDPQNSLTMPQGLIGYSDFREFGLLALPDSGLGAMMLLQSLSEASLSFIVAPYNAESGMIDDKDLADAARALGIGRDDLVVLLVVTVQREADTIKIYGNLRAPVMVDNEHHIARQYVLPNPKYPVRYEF
ncbi:MAG: flagellar assembly protein FliW [Alphaproteobacteria bacterium]